MVLGPEVRHVMVIGHWSLVICHLSFVICHLSFAKLDIRQVGHFTIYQMTNDK